MAHLRRPSTGATGRLPAVALSSGAGGGCGVGSPCEATAPAFVVPPLVAGASVCVSPASGPAGELSDLFTDLAARRVKGHHVEPLRASTPWLDLDHEGEITRVHYAACVLPDMVVQCPGMEVTVVGYPIGPAWIVATAVLGKGVVKGQCPR